VREYLDQLDKAAGVEPLVGERQQPPKSLSLTDPSAALTSKGKSKIAFAYGTNYLIDTKAAIIVDVEASPARGTAEVAATLAMIERAKERFGLHPKKLAADTAYGSGGNLAWLMDRKIEPHIPIFDAARRPMACSAIMARKRLRSLDASAAGRLRGCRYDPLSIP
jgi:hypothetical protein